MSNLIVHRVWDTRTLTAVKSVTTKNPITGIEISLDGKYLVLAAGKEVIFLDSLR